MEWPPEVNKLQLTDEATAPEGVAGDTQPDDGLDTVEAAATETTLRALQAYLSLQGRSFSLGALRDLRVCR